MCKVGGGGGGGGERRGGEVQEIASQREKIAMGGGGGRSFDLHPANSLLHWSPSNIMHMETSKYCPCSFFQIVRCSLGAI